MINQSVLTTPPPSGTNYSAEHGCFEGPEKLLEIWFSPTPFKNTTTKPYYQQDTNSEEVDLMATSTDSDVSDISTPSTPYDNGSYHKLLMDSSNLRHIEKSVWDDMLAKVKCTVLNVIHNAHVDAYLLSESSMFVYPHKVIIKTCGTTTLLLALPGIMNIAKKYCGLDSVYRLFYSRKSFMFPEKQPDLHSSWDKEVQFLDTYFDNGSSYIIGDTNKDEWYLYLTTPSTFNKHMSAHQVYQQQQNYIQQKLSKLSTWNDKNDNNNSGDEEDGEELNEVDYFTCHLTPLNGENRHQRLDYRQEDETIEILMTGLDPRAMEAFYQHNNEPTGIEGGKRVDRQTGLDQIYPHAKVDSFLFEPCGYSANGLAEDGYYTIHVTPEPQCSYASFETTIPTLPFSYDTKLSKDDTDKKQHAIRLLIRQVIDIFQPTNFTVTYFATTPSKKELGNYNDEEDGEDDEDDDNSLMMMNTLASFGGYKRKNKILHEFDGYNLLFGHYSRI
ncbi:S-adenosylmethionine decarboxylase [Cunninghamella echinulata]|nr:S-adenosylmethionine decarboxylase [Cunninghamella echinulata]